MQETKKLFMNSNMNSNFIQIHLSSFHFRITNSKTSQISLKLFLSSYLRFSLTEKETRYLYLALLRLIFTGSSTFSISSGSAMYLPSSTHRAAASSIVRSTLPAFASIKSLHKKLAVSSAEFGL